MGRAEQADYRAGQGNNPMNAPDYALITATFPDENSAKSTAKLLVERRLAACAQLFPIESIYSWQGKICDENEVMLLIKSQTALFDEIAATIKENHSYEVPEIVQIPLTDGWPDYLQWLEDSTK
jgi:periplasmic divalent cation tolerance protein